MTIFEKQEAVIWAGWLTTARSDMETLAKMHPEVTADEMYQDLYTRLKEEEERAKTAPDPKYFSRWDWLESDATAYITSTLRYYKDDFLQSDGAKGRGIIS